MDRERVNLIVRNMELLVQALKQELDDKEPNITENYVIDDYDEIFDECEE